MINVCENAADKSRRIRIESLPWSDSINKSFKIFKSAVSVLWFCLYKLIDFLGKG